MTARELLYRIVDSAPSMDKDIYITTPLDSGINTYSFEVANVTDDGCDDAVFVEIKPYNRSHVCVERDILNEIHDILLNLQKITEDSRGIPLPDADIDRLVEDIKDRLEM